MTIRKTVTLVEEINSEYGAPANPPLRRVAIAAVFDNPLAGKPAGADLKPLIDYSLELGATLTATALATLGAKPTELRAYTKASWAWGVSASRTTSRPLGAPSAALNAARSAAAGS